MLKLINFPMFLAQIASEKQLKRKKGHIEERNLRRIGPRRGHFLFLLGTLYTLPQDLNPFYEKYSKNKSVV